MCKSCGCTTPAPEEKKDEQKECTPEKTTECHPAPECHPCTEKKEEPGQEK